MSIQFSGLGSGLPIEDWIKKLVDAKKVSTVTPLETKKTTLSTQNTALSVINSSFTSLQNALKSLMTDVLSNDVWSNTNVKSQDSNYVTATSTSSAFKGDTSVRVLQLATSTVMKTSGDIVAENGKSATSTPLVSEDSPFVKEVGTGEILVNGQKFEIDENTTLNDLLKKINSNKDAGVNATYNTLTNKLTLTSADTGEKTVSISSGDTGFFEAMGLLDDTGAVIEGVQVLGKNAEAVVDGTKIVSASNTLTSSQTGIQGLTINLLKVPDDTSKEYKLTTSTNTLPAKQAMQTFVDSYNTLVQQIDEATRKNGYLEMDSGLRQIQQELRSVASSVSQNDGKYSMLSQIGVSTSKAGQSLDAETLTLKIDADKLNKAFDENFDSVKKLLTNNGLGIADQLLDKVSGALTSDVGYLSVKASTLTKQISQADKNITRANENLTSYKALLTKQFQQMDKMIASLNSQYAAFTSAINSLGSGKSSS